ncbi:MAG TPA: transcription termination factor NusA [Anaerolineales bacterium]|nr:transcription termination factor NusA [Anaerolineales bacterium]
MKNEFILAFNEVLEDKQLPKEVILEALESAMVSAYRKMVNKNTTARQEVTAKIDPQTGRVVVYAQKEVVEDVLNPLTECTLDNALEVDGSAQIGDLVMVDSTPEDFGRVAAQTARQVIQQRIREAERNAQLRHFELQVGEIVSGIVQASNAQSTTIGLDMKAEGILPASQRINNERFQVHSRVRAIILEVKAENRGPQIILSRAHRNFLRRLLETEVPEIYHGIVEIRSIAREPGQRAKVAVSATQPGIDPVGACVGIKGVRIQAIVKELRDEKIDIIEYNDDPVIYITKAISPARVTGVYANGFDRTATVVVMEDQLSLAIGRDGQNARLAAKLTNWRIDIKSVIEAASDVIVRLQNDASLHSTAELEKDNAIRAGELLDRKAENKPLTPEEYEFIGKFVDRVETRALEKALKHEAELREKQAKAREGIPEQAFEQPLEDLPLREHIFNILTEAEYLNIGELIMAVRSDPDSVFGLHGISDKSRSEIQAILDTYLAHFSVKETVEEVAPVEEPVEVVAEPEVVVEEEPIVEVVEEFPIVEEVVETPPVRTQEEEPESELSFEEMFTLRPDGVNLSAEEEEKMEQRGKKGKKSVTYEFDEDLGEVVSRKKHKRGDEDWTGESW